MEHNRNFWDRIAQNTKQAKSIPEITRNDLMMDCLAGDIRYLEKQGISPIELMTHIIMALGNYSDEVQMGDDALITSTDPDISLDKLEPSDLWAPVLKVRVVRNQVYKVYLNTVCECDLRSFDAGWTEDVYEFIFQKGLQPRSARLRRMEEVFRNFCDVLLIHSVAVDSGVRGFYEEQRSTDPEFMAKWDKILDKKGGQ